MRIPIIRLAQLGWSVCFCDSVCLTASGWDTLNFPNPGGSNAYALETSGESMETIYHKGDIVIVSPNSAVLSVDRVVVKKRKGEISASN